MAYTLLNDLRADRCSNTVKVRLLRLWEARNINKGGELMSVDMLLIDENSTVVHGSVSALLQLRFRPRMTEGSVYTLSGFDVTRSSPKYRLSDAPVAIRFNDGTLFEKLAMIAQTIPTEHFRFRPDTTVCVSIFDSLALAFHSKLDGYGREPRYRVILSVSDGTGAAAFLGFDEEVASLTHVLASDAAQIVEGGEVTDQALPQSVAPGSDVRAGITNNVADQLTEADGARLAHEAVASGEDAGEATARKQNFAWGTCHTYGLPASAPDCLTVSRTISSAVQDDHVIKRLNLRPQTMNPMLTFHRYQHLMVKAINSDIPAAHYTEGIKQFFTYDNRTIWLLHLKKSAEGSYDNGAYLYSILMSCMETLKKTARLTSRNQEIKCCVLMVGGGGDTIRLRLQLTPLHVLWHYALSGNMTTSLVVMTWFSGYSG
ncbi:hypothetical protein Bca52824_074869 [Brassica carinata]|uniref:Replication protein A 70 kDa DNA-binding subunit B/D first OB fold domain-containing protein n=1 Tax=Brassica carinata TaxID=52824 RepID=A0A8X7PQ38_BRACI|nr:hypothetical protein Bca52824_074869 [Brassica carinata]